MVFEEFSPVHANKDVGAIPLEMRTFGFQPVVVADNYQGVDFEVIRPRKWRLLPGAMSRIGSIAALRGCCRDGDVINLYHLSTKTLFQCLAIRLLLPRRVVIWLKLDMNTTERSLRVASLFGPGVWPRTFKEVGVKVAAWLICNTVNVVSAESSVCFRYVSRWRARRVAHLPNGIFRREFCDRHAIRENVICCVARHGDPNKRSEDLLRAFSWLNLPNWKLDLIGPYTDSFLSLYQEIVRADPGLAERIRLAGNISNREKVIERLAGSKIFVLLSYSEGFSLALLEAAASGCFCIATDVGGASDVLGSDGILLPRDFSPGQLHDSLRRATSQDRLEHSGISASTTDRFDWSKLLGGFVQNLEWRKL